VSGLLVVLEASPVVTLKCSRVPRTPYCSQTVGGARTQPGAPLARLRGCARLGVVAGQLAASK
jgi:hypothetical protein